VVNKEVYYQQSLRIRKEVVYTAGQKGKGGKVYFIGGSRKYETSWRGEKVSAEVTREKGARMST